MLIKEAASSPKKWSWLLYGVIFGYAAMTRTHAIIMPLVVGCVYFVAKYSKKRIILNRAAKIDIGFVIEFVMGLILNI